MPKRRRRPMARGALVGGEVHLFVERTARELSTRRPHDAQRQPVERGSLTPSTTAKPGLMGFRGRALMGIHREYIRLAELGPSRTLAVSAAAR